MNPDGYTQGFPALNLTIPGSAFFPPIQSQAQSSGPPLGTLLLALAGMGVITFILPRGIGEWFPILMLGGYAAAQTSFINNLLKGLTLQGQTNVAGINFSGATGSDFAVSGTGG